MATETVPPSPTPVQPPDRRIQRGRAAVIGVVAVAITVAVAELISALANWFDLLSSSSSPVGALGGAFIDISPGGLVEWAKENLGAPGDKIALGAGIGLTLLVVGALVGLVGRLHPWRGVGLAVLLAAVAAVAVLSRRDAGIVDLIPLAIGVLAGCRLLLAALRPRARITAPTVTAGPAGSATAAVARPAIADRRRFLQFAGYGALGAALTGVLSRLVPSDAATEASRAGLKLPSAAAETTAAGTTARSSASSTASSTAASRAAASSSAGTAASTAAGTAPSTSASARAAATAAGRSSAAVSTLDTVPGITPYLTANKDFYRIDTAFDMPKLTTAGWTLRIHGLVDHPMEITFDQLAARPQIERTITLTCVSNPRGGDLIGNAKWLGTRAAALLAEAKPQKGADCVLSTDAKGFTCTTPLEALTDDRDAILAIGMNGEPLPIEHGFPVRMVVPGLYGYVSATKWVVDWEVTRFDQVMAYWTGLGWSDHGPIKTSSRIDVPTDTVSAGRVPVAGVAWAQHRGVAKVQVQVDDGKWADAELSRPISKDTWVQWVYQWDAAPGKHTLRCRAIDSTGGVQIAKDSDVLPDGATGYHQRAITVTA